MKSKKKPCFFQSFNPSINSYHLKIPPRFVDHFEGQTSGTVTLLGPSGNYWLVDLVQTNEGLFFFNGWAEFVQDHLLEQGDALVFRYDGKCFLEYKYDGNLYFTVQVFDQNSCEKETVFSAECTQDSNHIDELMERKRERKNVFDIFEGERKKSKGLSQGLLDEGHVDELNGTHQAAIGSLETRNGSNPSKGASFANKAIRTVDWRRTKRDFPVRTLPTSEAEELARSFSSRDPNFSKTMKPFNVSGSYTLNIPCQFSMEHLPDCKTEVILRNLKGETWTVNSIPNTKVNMSHTLCGGWMAFVRDNNISLGDICIFELVGECELRVHILRVDREDLLSQNAKPNVKGTPNGYTTSRQLSDSSRKQTNGSACKVYQQQAPKVDVSDKKELCSKAFHSKSATLDNGSLEKKQGSYMKSCMSQKSVPEEKFAARNFVSTLPHFVRVMKPFNISGSYTLKIPNEFSRAHLPNCRTEIILRNLKGQAWSVNSVPASRVQTQHTFCGGWMAFVRENDLQKEDICIFELIGKCEMRVHMSGAGKNDLDYLSAKETRNGLNLATSVNNRS